MSTIVVDTQQLHIPPWVRDLGSFRRWARSDEFPEAGRVCYLFVAVRKQGGWLKSADFGKSFQLIRECDELGHPDFTLALR